MNIYHLPAINACLNASSAILLTIGYYFIRRGRIQAHRACMTAAFILSSVFLIFYLTYHWKVGSVRFQGEGWLRTVYLTILVTHSALAAVNVPLILRTLYLAMRGRFEEHRRIARWTLPSWLYVSVTGIVVYWMLYWRWWFRA